MILTDLGRIEEALALLEKQQAICQELGYREGLAYCHWYMADLARVRGDLPEARTRAEQSLAIFTELNMPKQIQRVQRLLEEINGSAPPSVA